MPDSPKIDTLRKLRLLIVDDNPGDRTLYKHYLNESDPGTEYHFLEAESGCSAMEVVQQGNIDCVLLDYLLPDIVGLSLLKDLRRQGQGESLPIILLTGFGDEATAVSALQGGAQGYISKQDLTGEKLNQAINQALKAQKDRQLLEDSRQSMADRNLELESKYEQIEVFYEQVLGKLRKPILAMRDRLGELDKQHTVLKSSELHDHLAGLCVESERILTMLKNLTDHSSIDVGQLLISTRPESLVEVINSIMGVYGPAAAAGSVRLSVRIQPDLPEVQIDRYRVEQVLSNLLDNAIRFSPPRGQVVLSADRLPDSDGFVTVSVKDSGPGMQPDQLKSLFEATSRELPDTSAAGQGMGLGLKVCREIIHSHKGEISAHNRSQAGTCITFTLPMDTVKMPEPRMWNPIRRPEASPTWELAM